MKVFFEKRELFSDKGWRKISFLKWIFLLLSKRYVVLRIKIKKDKKWKIIRF